MAEGIVEGLTSLFSGGKEKGTKAVGNKDMDILMVNVINADNAPIPIKLIQQKANVSKNVTDNDVVKSAGDLYTSIPAGFLLLHRDLSELIDLFKKGASSGGGGKPSTGQAMALGGVAGLAQGAVTGLIQGVSGLFSGEGRSNRKMASITADLIEEMTADDFRDDPKVQAQIHQGFIDYLSAYFTSQSAALVTSSVLGAVTESAGAAVGNVFKGLFKSLGGETKKSPLDQIIDDIMAEETSDKYIGDPEVAEATRKGVIGYLKTYFVTQTTAMATDNVIGGIGQAAGDAVGGILKGIFTLGSGPKSYDRIQSIVDDIVDAQTSSLYIEDPDVAEATKNGIVGYLKTYFAMQIATMATDSAMSMGGSAVGSALNSLFTNIFSLGSKEKSYSRIQNIIDDIIDAQDADTFIGNEVVDEAVQKGISDYIRTYFVAQAASMAADTIAEGVSGAAVSAVTNFFKGIFGKGSDEKSYDKIQSIVDTVINAQSEGNFIGDETVETAVKEGIGEYIKMYFKTQALAATADTVSNNIGSNVANAVTGFFKGLFGKAESSQDEKSFTKIQNIVDTVINAQSEGNFVGNEVVEGYVQEGIGEYIKTYFSIQAKIMAENNMTSNLGEKVGNFVSGLFGGIFKKKEETSEKSKFATTIASLTDDIDANDYKDSDIIKKAKAEGIAAALKAVLNVEAETFEDKYKSNIDKSTIRSSFAGVSEAYLSSVKRAVTFTETDITSEKVINARQKGLSDLMGMYFKNLNSDITDSSLFGFVSTSDRKKISEALTNRLVNSIESMDASGIEESIAESITAEFSNSSDAELQTVEVLNRISSLLESLSKTIEEIKENGGSVAIIGSPTENSDPGLE